MATKRRRGHSAEFKRETVELASQPNQSVAGVATDLGIPVSSLGRWRENCRHAAVKPSSSAPNQRWVAGITYIATAEGWLVLGFVMPDQINSPRRSSRDFASPFLRSPEWTTCEGQRPEAGSRRWLLGFGCLHGDLEGVG